MEGGSVKNKSESRYYIFLLKHWKISEEKCRTLYKTAVVIIL